MPPSPTAAPPGLPVPDQPAPNTYRNFEAILWAALSVAGSSALTLGVRAAATHLDPRFIVFIRFAATFAIILAVVAVARRFRNSLRFSKPWRHVLRGLFFVLSAHLGFYAIANLELVTATVLFFTAPIFATILSVTVLGEATGPRRLGAMLVGFLGVIIVLRPDTGSVDLAMFAALGSAMLFASALVMSRGMSAADGSNAVLFSSVGVTALLSLPVAMPVAEWDMPGWVWMALVVVVVTGGIRAFADIKSYSLGEASVIAPITYTRVVVIGIAAYLIWGEIPDPTALAGAVVIIGSALFIARREALAARNGKSTD